MASKVSTSSGNTVVEVPGMDLDPEDCAGWLHVKIGRKSDEKEAKPNARAARRATATATKAARMPGILPKEDKKIIDSAAMINENILNVRNPQAKAAQRIGTSTTIIVAFEGPKVPNYVYYGGGLLRCTLYRKHYDVCRTCGKVGHRSDVCPTPDAKICLGCGTPASQGHQCTPKCKLCGGSHITGDRECRNKFKTPYVVRRRQWERKAEVLAGKQEKAGKETSPLTAENFPPLRASVRASSRASSRSRSRSRSAGGKVTWEANRQQAKKIAEQDAVIRRMAADMAAMREMIQQLQGREQKPAEERAETAEEPPIKRKSTEGSRTR
ncbi:unnamed protein product, partial [Ixodes hexagonus]